MQNYQAEIAIKTGMHLSGIADELLKKKLRLLKRLNNAEVNAEVAAFSH